MDRQIELAVVSTAALVKTLPGTNLLATLRLRLRQATVLELEPFADRCVSEGPLS